MNVKGGGPLLRGDVGGGFTLSVLTLELPIKIKKICIWVLVFKIQFDIEIPQQGGAGGAKPIFGKT